MKYQGISFMCFVLFQQFLSPSSSSSAAAGKCGKEASGAVCPGEQCCSGTTDEYCGKGCQTQCDSSGAKKGTTHNANGGCGDGDDESDSGAGLILSRSMFDQIFKHRNDDDCPGKGFYTYDAFIEAAKSFPDFATTGDQTTRKREFAAFVAQISHETTGGDAGSKDGRDTWGVCYYLKNGIHPQLTVIRRATKNTNVSMVKVITAAVPSNSHGTTITDLAGRLALGIDLLKNPDLVIKDLVIAFKSSLWFWTSATSSTLTCHDAITAKGFGMVTTKLINGRECGKGTNDKVKDRIGYYKRYCDMLGISYGNNLDC